MSISMPRGLGAVLAKSAADTVLLSAVRTPICRAYKGRLKDAYPEELLSVVLGATLEANARLAAARIEDVGVGVVLSELGGSKAARMAMNHVGYPSSSALYTVNRACASSLHALALVAAQIRTGQIGVGVAAGMESMTRNYGSRAIPTDLWPDLKNSEVKDVQDCVMPMGLTSEEVARRYGVCRSDQDAFAAESHRRAARARAEGRLKAEIVPVTTRFSVADGQTVHESVITVTEDDGIRTNVSLEALAKLPPAFAADGASTAGNSSQVSDGAAAVLLARRDEAEILGLGPPLGRFVGASVVGCAPDEMGIGPALAVPRLLDRFGLRVDHVSTWEINEAFASQVIYCVRKLGLEAAWEDGRVNPNGGAIALGHPLGATGARMVATLMHEMSRDELGVVTMCVGKSSRSSRSSRWSACIVMERKTDQTSLGTGMGMSGLFVRE